MSLDANKQLIQEFHRAVMVERNLDAVAQFLRDPFVDHSAPSEDGLASYVQWLQTYLTAFPDFTVETEDFIAEDDLVSTHLKITGTQQSEFLGAPATWKPFTISGMQLYRIADGKISERWGWVDVMSLRTQLGIQG